MLTYKAMYKFVDSGVHGEVPDPSLHNFEADLEESIHLVGINCVP